MAHSSIHVTLPTDVLESCLLYCAPADISRFAQSCKSIYNHFCALSQLSKLHGGSTPLNKRVWCQLLITNRSGDKCSSEHGMILADLRCQSIKIHSTSQIRMIGQAGAELSSKQTPLSARLRRIVRQNMTSARSSFFCA